ncbi:MAG: glutamate-1-semialdehyde 2,1-aminomutase [Verrucomicrobia bacterium]|jgi:glutamate-1-semialdehyde 2,1-aminomutase|nr:glutamate-1-semialdehyde 2,1-aminomutase [Verrucomicrobiota bacterium]OQC67376.1 MAG: Glutamate-1-semialdehyde 2,1-aminomutase [Verrucomicrobia bacterium ADurb.Bin006]MDI9379604.1 glutamate-1-semialdehyde 2,1-aminomutase [Verrucomicrobiota bacterium]NMD21344.1 glutamate-1-semialdehyde 2,1-aminomutase [Verrucomicrobiota bacterium]HNU99320.1 glutamate-1-semialdehyde 2,1-aminomutase [Verrucomicrobiota bacterium]
MGGLARKKSDALFAEALERIPGGVNSPVRAFRAVGGKPFFVDRARGCRVWDVDGNEYIDYIGTWGPAIHGHAHPRIIEAIRSAAERGTSFGIPNPLEVKMASLICEAVPSVEKVRMCNSGTEACMAAIRVARGHTKRNKVIKFEGCYHGHVDSLLVNAGSGALTFGHPDSAGVPAAFTQHTVVVRFNDIEAVKAAFLANSNDIAAVILEPVPGNAGLYLPKPGFLTFLREITREEGAVLIFDEVMTGFRLARGGAQERFGVQPDLTCFGKIIGGGLPVGAFGGRRDIMNCLAPLGPVYQAGTLSGNPLAMAAGIVALEMLGHETYNTLEKLGAQLEEGMLEAARAAGVPVQFLRCGSMFCCYFTDLPVHDLADAMKSDRDRFARYFHRMLDGGISLAPSQFEAGFLCTAHTPADIERTVEAAARALRGLN